MKPRSQEPYYRSTAPFADPTGRWWVAEVLSRGQRLRLSCQDSGLFEEISCPISTCGCYIEELAPSASGAWLVSQRNSGQGEWGYDIFSTRPLARVGGVEQERGYILELPRFFPQESYLIGAAGEGFLGGWWSEEGSEQPAAGGPVELGFLFVHGLPGGELSRHRLWVELPEGWIPEDPWAPWYGPGDLRPAEESVGITTSWGATLEVGLPLPDGILLPTPAPSGRGVL